MSGEKAYLCLADGTVFEGVAWGASGIATGEVVFTTGMTGYEVAAELRRDPSTRFAKLIAVTGYGRDEDRRRSKEAGFDMHLTKPVDPAKLRALLEERPASRMH